MSALCLVHQRFSTNTFPTWQLAHPYRYICHNGEINTLRGNVNWMYARQSVLASPLFGDDIKKLFPIVTPGGSDSARSTTRGVADAGRPQPAARDGDADSGSLGIERRTCMPEKKAFYEYHASLMEPWDGPAAMAFTDGRVIGATLDRNGLRPARYLVTHDGLVIMASETGVLPVKPEEVRMKGRLQPGKMLLVDTEQDRIVPDEEIKQQLATRQPYAQWLKENQITLDDLPEPPRVLRLRSRNHPDAAARLRLYRRRSAHPAWRRWRRRARSRSARWAPTRRWPVCPTSRSRCSTTSSSCSRR